MNAVIEPIPALNDSDIHFAGITFFRLSKHRLLDHYEYPQANAP